VITQPVKAVTQTAAHAKAQTRTLRLGNHLKAAIDYHFKTGHRETA
jgi:hypothetical protein